VSHHIKGETGDKKTATDKKAAPAKGGTKSTPKK
jgi:hypothetical protein